MMTLAMQTRACDHQCDLMLTMLVAENREDQRLPRPRPLRRQLPSTMMPTNLKTNPTMMMTTTALTTPACDEDPSV